LAYYSVLSILVVFEFNFFTENKIQNIVYKYAREQKYSYTDTCITKSIYDIIYHYMGNK
jgi:hypothetical protein